MSYRPGSYSVSSMRPVGSVRSSQVMTVQRSMPLASAASVYGGAGGRGSRISVGGSSSGFGSGLGSGAGGSYSSMSVSGSGLVGNEKETMIGLNDRLAAYLETVRNLEQANSKLEFQIREALEKKGPTTRDLSPFEKTLEDLRKKVYDMTMDNSRLVLQIDNSRLAADDFRVKFESEYSIRQSVESDIIGLRKVIDDTNMGRMNLESEIESLKEELIFIKQNHNQEVNDLRNQIAQSGVQVDVDAPKGQDLAQVLAEVRAQYESMAQKNRDELKAWHENKLTEVEVEVIQNTEALQGARTEVTELRRQMQSLEIELESQRSMKASLEDSLRDTEMRNNMEMERYNNMILQLEAELGQLRGNIQMQASEYEALLNIKMKLEAEIATYRRLLDGEDFRLQDALVDQSSTKSIKKVTVTQTLVDGKVVSESTNTKEIGK
ncbi:keratin, type I cytoskeletal 18 [Acipenser ruthenus]|uniref:Keratin, type I cytoskeletal 18 n=1 Tax=Acipenser baerii TaxID=27689 RepID=K1C18_ACIBE|nr:keratin, type I cytoskeletal 18 [Acipenser ruthenus]Q7SYF8.1 RecName: Full=Keratin, type I cytoskeletal 18; AltName: Full=Cytokeratin-18; Short=CK-18; AltName: Full=Keratin type Is; AltName: Full=Keratin-18; Short=K18 [Acipenser baerii]CAD38124.1 keratin type Is [Acipenser baerii]